MFTYHACSKCDAPVRRSRRRNMWEFILAAFMLPYRCTVCDLREMKLRFINMEPNSKPEDTELIISGLDEQEMEQARIAEAKAAERAAYKAEKERMKELARKDAEKEAKRKAKEAEKEAKRAAKEKEETLALLAREKSESKARAKASAKKAAKPKGDQNNDQQEETAVSRQSNTSAEAEEQISSN